ncbi:MAG: arginine--tRNA ligase [Acidimicrobiia bacterium]|nr:arginine--tRNA ligase [Acidimicrobiia bacterium]MDH3462426.1 arginine--tRNA ligase [Acidimicrobiia bacterium]
MSILSHLSDLVGQAFVDLGLPADLGAVVPSARPELAQFQCNGAMAAARAARRPPGEIAADIVARIEPHELIGEASVAPPGFINFDVTSDSLAAWANQMAADDHLGFPVVTSPETVVVDYAGPNVAKAMHIGHIRATIIGDSLGRLFSFAGHKVIRDPHFGDWGFQMGLLIAAIEEESPDLPYFDDGEETYPSSSPVSLDDLQRIYPAASQRAREDESFAALAREKTVALQQGHRGYRALWSQMKSVSEASQRDDFAALGVKFDLWYGESDVQHRLEPLVARLKESGVAEESEGALIVSIEDPNDNRELPPLILESSAGGFLYSTTDLATLEMRVEELSAELILYVVDRRQADHFTQVFRASRKGGIVPDRVRLEHIGFGTMNGPDGKPFRTREGGVVRLSDLIEIVVSAAKERLDEAHLAEEYPEEERMEIAAQVGIAALKYGDLINNRSSDYIFDLDRFSSFEGKTGPYLQYAAVRIKSILRKAAEQDLSAGTILGPEVDAERELILELVQLPEVVERAIDLRAPNHVAEYANAVAGRFNRFYDVCHILSEPDPLRQSSLLALSAWSLRSLEQLLYLLGIEVPERM